MQHFRGTILPALIASILIGLLVNTGITEATTQPSCVGWSIVASPNLGSNSNDLNGVVAVSTNDVWAVGQATGGKISEQTLIEHWNGTQWSIVSSPNPSNRFNNLSAVAAISAKNIWAVGDHQSQTAAIETLIEQWDGSHWHVVSGSNPSTTLNNLESVAAITANDVWAVGYYRSGNNDDTLIEHWNGSSWSVIASPNPGTVSNVLYSVSAISSNDIWASGNYLYGNNNLAGFVEHWNGSQWSIVPSPNALTLNAITAISANDVWAVGININNKSTGAEHWDGSQWSVFPSRGGFGSDFSSVNALSSNNVWAVGSIENRNTQFQTLTEHWDGSHWYIKASPNMPGANNQLFAVTHVPGRGSLWAVGSYDPANTLTEYHC